MIVSEIPSVRPGTPAVVLLSGGLDSATVLAWATRAGYAVHALSFRYGQRHQIELERARMLAAKWCVVRHVESDIDLRPFGGSALTDANINLYSGAAMLVFGIVMLLLARRATASKP